MKHNLPMPHSTTTSNGHERARLRDAPHLPYLGMRSPRRFVSLASDALRLSIEAAPREFVVSILLQLIGAFGVGVMLLVIRQMITGLVDDHGVTRSFSSLIPALVALFVVVGVIALSSGLQRQVETILSEKVVWLATQRLYDTSVAVDLLAFDDPDFHDRLQRARAGFRGLQMTRSLMSLLVSLTGTLIILVVLLVLQPILVPLMVLAVVPLAFSTASMTRDQHALNTSLITNDRERWYLQQILTGRDYAKEVRAFGLAPYVRGIDGRLFATRMEELRRLTRQGGLKSLLGGLGTVAGIGSTITALAYLVINGHMGLGAAAAAIAAILQLTPMLSNLAQSIALLYECALFVDDYRTFCQLGAGIDAQLKRGPVSPVFTGLAVDSLTFTYPSQSRPALRNVSMEIRNGEVVALVGRNGSGKSTLVKLLCQLYQPDSGCISWNDTRLSDVDPEEARHLVSVIFQDFKQYLFSVHQNIGIGWPERIDERDAVVKAAQQAGADEFIVNLPYGYDTFLGQVFANGADLSIGQWQRIALARAFFREAPLVILDEPTAALDSRAEYELFKSMRELCTRKTVLLISHRFSSVSMADRIYVMDDGEVVEQGTHLELLDKDGLYAELFGLQAEMYLGRGRTGF